jgi:hypothetical protein
MEDFGWIIFLAVFWILSLMGEQRKKQGKKRRAENREHSAPGERDAQVGPAAGRRDLARDLEEGARRAEEALRRWEARQEQRGAPAPARVDDPRREAYEAIAEMLEERTPEPLPEVRPEAPPAERRPPAERPVRRAASIRGPSLLTKGGTLTTARRPVAALVEPPVRVAESGLDRIERLAPLQRAVVWRELLGPPVSLREDT